MSEIIGQNPQENRRQDYTSLEDLAPTPELLNALRGTITEPITTISQKPDSKGQEVTVRLAKEGAGMFGLTDWKDNKTWSGMFNHTALSGRYGGYFSLRMLQRGYDTDPQRIINTHYVSHAGRRVWEEAIYYPEAVENGVEKRSKSNETLGMEIIRRKVPDEIFELVVALGHNVEGFSVDPAIYESLDYKIAIYADHRTTQKYEPLNTRMGDFLLQNFFAKEAVTPEKKEEVYQAVGDIINRQKAYQFGENEGSVSVEEADSIADQLGAQPDSPRLSRIDIMHLILQDADTEAILIQNDIDPNSINDITVPMPQWENNVRRQYVFEASESIAEEINKVVGLYGMYILTDGEFDEWRMEYLNKEFPLDTWWGKLARQAFYEWQDSNAELKTKARSDAGRVFIQAMIESKFKRPEMIAG